MDFHSHVHLDLAGLEPMFADLIAQGERMAVSLDGLTAAITELTATLDTELTEIATALQNATGDQAALQATIDAQAGRVVALRDRVAGIVP